MSYTIVTDSSCNLDAATIDQLGLEILPLTFMLDGVERLSYVKGEAVDLAEFYTAMREGKVITTSTPHLGFIDSKLREVLQRGDDILYIGFSSGLSGTYEATALQIEALRPEFPDRKMIAIDTFAAALGEGLLVYIAAKMKLEGKSMEEVAAWVEDNKFKAAHWFTVDDLMFLFRGGRVSRTSAWAGTLLNIKPILKVDEAGKLIPMEKVRSRKKSIKALFDHMKNSAVEPVKYCFISHGDCEEEANQLADMIRAEFGNDIEFLINILDPVIGAHAGPGTIALFYMGTGRND